MLQKAGQVSTPSLTDQSLTDLSLLQKAGHSENVPDQSVVVSHGNTATSAAVTSATSTSTACTFKVGDKVKVVRAENGTPESSVGKILTVTRVYGSPLDLSDGKCYNLGQLAPAEYKPEVGDVVKCPCDKREWIVFTACYDGEATLGVVTKDKAWNPLRNPKSVEFIRKSGVMPDAPLEILTAYSIAKAYFAKPEFKGTYEERQAQWVEHHGIKVGSKVRVVARYERNEGGFIRIPSKGKDDAVSKTFEVIKIEKDALKLSTCVFGAEWYPYFVLEPVE